MKNMTQRTDRFGSMPNEDLYHSAQRYGNLRLAVPQCIDGTSDDVLEASATPTRARHAARPCIGRRRPPFGRDRDQETAGGLRVVEELHTPRIQPGRELDPAAEMLLVGAAAARGVPLDQIQRALEQRHARGLDRDDAAAGPRHLRRVADQSEAGDVGAGVHGAGRQRASASAAARLSCTIDAIAASATAGSARGRT